MKHSRLFTALEDGLAIDGPLHVVRPPVGYDLAGLTDVTVETPFFPDHAYWSAAGRVGDGAGRVATLVVLPRSKTLARQMVNDAISAGGLVIVDGQKTDGVESIYKDLRKHTDIAGVITKGHGRLFWFAASAPIDWPTDVVSPEGFKTVPGVFSEAKIDAGSALLRPHVTALKGRVADLGAGWGYLSRAILQSDAVTAVDMVEADKAALDCAAVNVPDSRAQAHWADALTFAGGPYDAVVSNPPFHTARDGDPDLGRGFIATASRLLTPRGVFLMVANRHLPYESTLEAKFGRVEELDGSGGFKMFRATKPKR